MDITYLLQESVERRGHGINWNVFSLANSCQLGENLIEEFIHSETFKEDTLPNVAKRSANRDRFLKKAFKEEELHIRMFKKMSKVELKDFLIEYSKDDSWRDDRNDFIIIMNRFIELLQIETTNRFYLLNKDWFRADDPILSLDSPFYTYYLLIVWVDEHRRILNVCEWRFD